jgi:hypothetical protein
VIVLHTGGLDSCPQISKYTSNSIVISLTFAANAGQNAGSHPYIEALISHFIFVSMFVTSSEGDMYENKY